MENIVCAFMREPQVAPVADDISGLDKVAKLRRYGLT